MGEHSETAPLSLPAAAVRRSAARAPELIETMRVFYEAGATQQQTAEKFGTSRSAIGALAKRQGWEQRQVPAKVQPRSLTQRMLQVLERQIVKLETEMTDAGDKEVALLGNMARTLEKLIEIDGETRGSRSGDTQRKDMSDLRRKLGERIEQLKRR